MIDTVRKVFYPLYDRINRIQRAIRRDGSLRRASAAMTEEGGNMPLSALTESIFEFRRFIRRYQRVFRHPAQFRHFEAYIRGLIGPLERKSIEPIAIDQGIDWRRLDDFIASSPWDAESLLIEHRRHLRMTLGSLKGILILDPTSFPKRGDKSVGVTRQWCGQLGKEENCVVGVNLSYASEKGHAFLDRRLYLPDNWVNDYPRRRAARVPDDVVFRTSGQLGCEMLSRMRRERFPHSWITGDEEFGKLPWLHDSLHADGERYVFEIPTSATIWLALPKRHRRGRIGTLRHYRICGPGRPRKIRVDALLTRLPERLWRNHEVRDGSKGPISVRAALLRVKFNRRNSLERPERWLLITQTLDQRAETKYFTSNAAEDVMIEDLLLAAFSRWTIEQNHGQGKNETGLGDYETRSWPGWHHHTAIAFLAYHWLVLERNRLGEKIPRDDHGGGAQSLLRRLADPSRPIAEVGSAHATPAEAESRSAALALEEVARSSSDAEAAHSSGGWTDQFDVHSIDAIETGQ